MDRAAVMVLDTLSSVSILILLSLGLAVIFGMMRVINLAHGEFLMLGAYAAVLATRSGINIWVAMLVIAPLFVGLFGIVVEQCIIRFLYGRPVDTMLATWGLSLLTIGAVTTIFGNTVSGISSPLGGISVGSYRFSLYLIFLIAMAAALMVVGIAMLYSTRTGMVARAAMQNAAMASGLGVDSAKIYRNTFGIGAALSGLAGGLLAPISGVSPTMGSALLAKTFITVITGGAAIFAGTASAAGIFGILQEAVTILSTPVWGQVAILLGAIILIRIFPRGLSGKLTGNSR